MSCGRNKSCGEIANNYANSINELNSCEDSLIQAVDNVVGSLSSINIPNDYLGKKVLNSVQSLKTTFNTDKNNISSCIQNGINFASKRESEHSNHYINWKLSQDEEDS